MYCKVPWKNSSTVFQCLKYWSTAYVQRRNGNGVLGLQLEQGTLVFAEQGVEHLGGWTAIPAITNLVRDSLYDPIHWKKGLVPPFSLPRVCKC